LLSLHRDLLVRPLLNPLPNLAPQRIAEDTVEFGSDDTNASTTYQPEQPRTLTQQSGVPARREARNARQASLRGTPPAKVRDLVTATKSGSAPAPAPTAS